MIFSSALTSLNDIQEYYDANIQIMIFSLPKVSLRPVRVYEKNEIIEGVKQIHQMGGWAALDMSAFFFEEDLPLIQETIHFCKQNKLDLVYFSDMSVFQVAQAQDYGKHCFYQPNTLITNASDAKFYLDCGMAGVSLAREITLVESLEIANQVQPCEMVIHGKNIMMHSRRKLVSSYFEFCGIQANGASKQLSLMEEKRDTLMPIIEDEQGSHVFSAFTLFSFNEIKQLSLITIGRIENYNQRGNEIVQIAQAYLKVLNNEIEADQISKQYFEKDASYSSGFMYLKTSTVKEAL